VTLHFNVFQAGVTNEGRRSLRIENPQQTTVVNLKRELFNEALQEQKSVRFIASGRILDDSMSVEKCGLGTEAFIHVSISNSSSSNLQPAQKTNSTTENGPARNDMAPATNNEGSAAIGTKLLLGSAFFAGTGILLQMGWKKRWQLSMHGSQFLFILGAVWIYLLVCDFLPIAWQAFSQALQRTASGASTVASGSSNLNVHESSTQGTTISAPGTAAVQGPGLGPMTAMLQEGRGASQTPTLGSSTGAGAAVGSLFG